MSKKHYWFRAKRLGWGWYPSSWQGWLVTLVFSAVVIGTAVGVEKLGLQQPINTIVTILALTGHTLIFIGIAHKTGETPKWSWPWN